MTGTQLALRERAAIALGNQDEQHLTALAAESAHITTITNADGYQQVDRARIVLKNERVALQKIGKSAREDATAFSKAVIAEEARLINIVAKEEDRLHAIQKGWDAEILRKKNEEIAREQARVDEIRMRLAAMERAPLSAIGRNSRDISEVVERMRAVDVETFAELRDAATEVKGRILGQLTVLYSHTVSAEENAAEVAKQQEALRARESDMAKREEKLQREGAAIRQRQEDSEKVAVPPPPAPSVPTRAGVAARAVPALSEMIDVLAQHYRAHPDTIRDWLGAYDMGRTARAA